METLKRVVQSAFAIMVSLLSWVLRSRGAIDARLPVGILAFAFGTSLLVLPAPAAAFSVDAEVEAFADGGTFARDSNFGVPPPLLLSVTSVGDMANASAEADAVIGALGAYASANGLGFRGTSSGFIAQSSAIAGFFDEIFVGSANLAPGTPVMLSIDTSLSGTFLPPPSGAFQAEGLATFEASFPGGVATAQASQGIDWMLGTTTGDSGPGIFTTTIGSQVVIRGLLVAHALALDREGSNSVAADFGATAVFFVDALTPGVMLSSASGHNYASVPEPATILLLSSALLSVGFIRLLRRLGINLQTR